MIRNTTKHQMLAKNLVKADSLVKKMFGLMFKKEFSNKGMIFIFNIEKKLNFHTFFMKFAIDFLFLNKNFRVVRVFRNINPWKINIIGKAKYVVELPAGNSLDTIVGDKISFK